jgi:hypothetical protein
MPCRRYEVRVTGRVSSRACGALTDMEVEEVTAETVISGLVHQEERLHDVLSAIQALGLHVVSVQRVGP